MLLSFFLILSVSAGSYFDLQAPPAISSETLKIDSHRKEFTKHANIINQYLSQEGMFSENEIENIVKLLKVYAKVNSNMFYSPDLFTAEKSTLIFKILNNVLKKIPQLYDSGLYYSAFECGQNLGAIRGYFEYRFQKEAKELREYLKEEKLIQPVFDYINYGESAKQPIDKLDPDRSAEINRRSTALREKVVKATFSSDFEIHYQDLFSPFEKEMGLQKDEFKFFLPNFMNSALYSLYEKEFPTSQELYHALFGDTLKLTTLDGTPIYDAFQLDWILLGLKGKYTPVVTQYKTKFGEGLFNKLFGLAIGKLESHKTRAKELVFNLSDPLDFPSFESLSDSPQKSINNSPEKSANNSPSGGYFKKFIIPAIIILFLMIIAGVVVFFVRKRRGK
jgi:hypothetical protein